MRTRKTLATLGLAVVALLGSGLTATPAQAAITLKVTAERPIIEVAGERQYILGIGRCASFGLPAGAKCVVEVILMQMHPSPNGKWIWVDEFTTPGGYVRVEGMNSGTWKQPYFGEQGTWITKARAVLVGAGGTRTPMGWNYSAPLQRKDVGFGRVGGGNWSDGGRGIPPIPVLYRPLPEGCSARVVHMDRHQDGRDRGHAVWQHKCPRTVDVGGGDYDIVQQYGGTPRIFRCLTPGDHILDCKATVQEALEKSQKASHAPDGTLVVENTWWLDIGFYSYDFRVGPSVLLYDDEGKRSYKIVGTTIRMRANMGTQDWRNVVNS